jgi:peptide/nickel transport system permease protein
MAEMNSFKLVGTEYKTYVPCVKKIPFCKRLKGKPIISAIILAVIILGCVFAEKVGNHNPTEFYLQNLNTAPNSEFYFGTDSLGRDIFSMIWYGGRVSIAIGLMSMVIISVIGITYGCISGVSGEKVDAIMMRAAEIGNSIPSILLVILIMSVLGEENIFKISFVIGISGWFALARIVRSEVRQIRNSDYVLSAKTMGVGFFSIMIFHLIPNFVSSIMFVIVSSISSSIAMESTLSFLGLGLPVDVISWGSMLSLANKALLLNTWWVIIIPGLFLMVTLNCITNIGSFFRKETNRKHSNL